MMKRWILILWINILFLALANAQVDTISIAGSHLLLTKTPYTSKGVCYNLVPKGSDKRSSESLTDDLVLM